MLKNVITWGRAAHVLHTVYLVIRGGGIIVLDGEILIFLFSGFIFEGGYKWWYFFFP